MRRLSLRDDSDDRVDAHLGLGASAKRRRVSARKAVSIGVALLCCCYIFYHFYRHQGDLRVLAGLSPAVVLGMLSLRLVQYLLQSRRHHIIVQGCSGSPIPYRDWLSIYTVGQFLNLAFAQLGNIYRCTRLKEDYQIPYARYVGSVLFAAWAGIVASLFLTVIVLGAAASPKVGGALTAWLLAGVLMGIIAVPPALACSSLLVRFRREHCAWLRGRLAEVIEAGRSTVVRFGSLGQVIALGMAIFIVSCAALRLGFYGLGVEVGLAEIVLFGMLMQLSTLMMITPGNVGVQELLLGVVGLYLDTGFGQVILVSALLRALDFGSIAVLALPMGGIAALRGRAALRGLNLGSP